MTTNKPLLEADFHLHTSFSFDSNADPETMVQRAIELGLDTMCFTDHQDRDCPEESILDIPAYVGKIQDLQEQYADQIDIRLGIELGMQPHLAGENQRITATYPFDFVIGSVHMVEKQDPYYPEFFAERTDEEAYRKAFLDTVKDMEVTDFDVLGHIDYVVRYGKTREKLYSYARYADVIDPILEYVIRHDKGIELNTSGWKYGLGFCHPHPDIIRRYCQMGGRIITVGSDAHRPEHIAYDFSRAYEVLKACGFTEYCTFQNRLPKFRKIV